MLFRRERPQECKNTRMPKVSVPSEDNFKLFKAHTKLGSKSRMKWPFAFRIHSLGETQVIH